MWVNNNSYNYNYVFNCINFGFYIYSFITFIYSLLIYCAVFIFGKLSGQCFVLLNKLIVILINRNNLFYTCD